jgi:hypothetical protein
MIKPSINGEDRAVDVDSATPLLCIIRDYVGLTGTRLGCGIAQCGAGEPGTAAIAPALTNAIFIASGGRIARATGTQTQAWQERAG